MATKRALLRLILAALLLVAQHAALTHAAWHAFHGTSSARALDGAGSVEPGDTAPESKLCAFDVVLGEVLGGASTAGHCPCAVDPESQRVGQTPRSHCTSSPVSFFSRAPPAFL